MGWSERQHAMLEAMGLRLWSPTAEAEALDVEAVVDPPAQVTAQRSAPRPVAMAAEPATPTAAPATLPTAVTRPVAARPVPVQVVPAGATRHTIEPARDADAEARARHLGTLDGPALREAAASCRACSLGDTRTQAVFGVGHPQAHWMVVGEAPGEQEDRLGQPFVGPSGELLDAMLRALRLTRAEDGPAPPAQRVYIANTVKCRPPRNRNPSADELARCEPFLVRQIQLVQPRIILAMGRFAVQALLRTDEPIGRLRGRVHRYQGVPLIVTYHPAYLLRYLPDKARAWDDLCLAAATAEQAG